MEMGLGLPEHDRMTHKDMLVALKRVASRHLPSTLLTHPEASR